MGKGSHRTRAPTDPVIVAPKLRISKKLSSQTSTTREEVRLSGFGLACPAAACHLVHWFTKI